MTKNNRIKKGFIGIEVAIVASVVLLTGFAAINSFNARATNAKDGLIGQFQNAQLNLNGSGGQLTDEQINQLKSAVLDSIDINAIRTSVLNLINIASMKQELLSEINAPAIREDILATINVPQIQANIMATVNVPQIKSDIVAEINVPQIKTDIMASFPTDADTVDGLHASSFVRSDVNDGNTPSTGVVLSASTGLNTITVPGFYFQPSTPTGSNYPIARGGSLLVQKSVGTITQTYTTDQGHIYTRSLSGTWTAWITQWNSANSQPLMLSMYPVGAIYISASSTSPATLFGGTWTKIENRFLVAAGTSYAAGTTGGSETHTHTLNSGYAMLNPTSGFSFINRKATTTWTENIKISGTVSSSTYTNNFGTSLGGTTDNESNIPPYLSVHMWQRTN